MHVQHTSIYVLCPVCGSGRVAIDDQERTAWRLYDLTLRCTACDATFTAHYECYAVSTLRYGNPIGPVYLTNDPQQALAAWEADDNQWIRTDETSYAVGYAPTLLDGGRQDDPQWRDIWPDDLEVMLVQEVRP